MACWICRFVIITCLVVGSRQALAQETVKTHWNANMKQDILKIGKFDGPADRKAPEGWSDVSAFDSGNARLNPGGRGSMTLKSADDDTDTFVEAEIEIPASAKYLTFLVTQRAPSLTQTIQPNSGAGVQFFLIKDDGERALRRIEPSYQGYRDWFSKLQTAEIKPGETKLRISVEITKATGELDIDTILVIPSDDAGEATRDEQRHLEQAFNNDDADTIERLIKDNPQLLEVRMGVCDNGTPLICAAWHGATNVAQRLIKLGADLEAKDPNWGNTPLRWCCWYGIPEVTQVLMQAGAQAEGASAMARSSSVNNRFAQRTKEDFERTAEIIDDFMAKRKAAKK